MPIFALIPVIGGVIGGFLAGRYVLPEQKLPSCVEQLIRQGIDKDIAVSRCSKITTPVSPYSMLTPVVTFVAVTALLPLLPKVVRYLKKE